MKRILLVLLFALNVFAIDGTSLYWTVKLTGDTATVSRLKYNYDSLKNWTDKAADTMNYSFPRFSPSSATHDSVIKYINIDSIGSSPFIDTIRTNVINADSAYIDTAFINQLLGSVEIDTLTLDTANITALKSTRAWIGTIDTVYSTKGVTSAKGLKGTIGTFSSTITTDSLSSTKKVKSAGLNSSGNVSATTGTYSSTVSVDSLYSTKGAVIGGKLGIGVTPTYDIDVLHNQNNITGVWVTNTTNGTGAQSAVACLSYDGNIFSINAINTGHSTTKWSNKGLLYSNNNAGMVIEQAGNYPIDFWRNSIHALNLADGNLSVIDNGSDPEIRVGDTTTAGNYGYMRWNSAGDSLSIGTQTGGNALVIKENKTIGLRGLINIGPIEKDTIASNAITITKSYAGIYTEGGAGSDTVDNINAGTAVVGDVIYIENYSSIYFSIGVGNVGCATSFNAGIRCFVFLSTGSWRMVE